MQLTAPASPAIQVMHNRGIRLCLHMKKRLSHRWRCLTSCPACDWNEFRDVRGEQQPQKLKDGELAAMLREFKIMPRSIWPLERTANSRSAKGYRRLQFEKAWRLYCIDDGTSAQSSNVRNLRRADDGTA